MNSYTEILKAIAEFDEVPYYIPNGGNIGDALIACNEFQFFKEHNVKYRPIKELDTSKPYCLIYGGGGAFVPYWGYTQKLPEYLTNKNLKKCIILPQSFYQCDLVFKVLDERFVVLCRDRQSYEYCIKSNQKARFVLCDDMAFSHDFSRLNIDNIVDQIRETPLFKNAICKIDDYFKQNQTSTAVFIRNDKESIQTPKFNMPNLDLSTVFIFRQTFNDQIALAAASVFIYAIKHYDTIITNRLHVAIAAFLMGKKIELYDNSYHKIKNVYDMTMKDIPNKITPHFNLNSLQTNDLLNNAFVLSIDDSRIDILKQLFEYHGLACPKVFHGFKNQDIQQIFWNSQTPVRDGNAYKCGLGHAAIVRTAKALDLPYVLVFEDDTYPIDNIKEKLDYYLSDIPDDTSVLVLGWSYTNTKPVQVSDRWYRPCSDTHGSHAYVVFKNAYDRYLEIYDADPTTPSDHMMMKVGPAYMPSECLFIQYNMNKSNWGCLGYVFELNQKQYQSAVPPAGFSKIDDLIELPVPEFMRNPELISFLDKCIQFGKFNTFTDKSKCIIIGAGPSICNFEIGNEINDSDAYVIRLNRHPDEKYFKNYGSRTDLFFGREYLKDLLADVLNKVIIGHSLITDISKYFSPGDDKWLSTGMIAILLFSRVFQTVEIFGFGVYGEKTNSDMYSSINEKLPIPTHYNIDYEHELLDRLEDVGMLTRLETKYSNK